MHIKLHQGDITTLSVDAIVNAANKTLLGGGGVDGAIHRAAGPELLEECKRIIQTQYPDGLPTGKAVITKGYNLPANHVIHTVGPVYDRDSNPAKHLADCYTNSLILAHSNGLESIAFPAISTGVYGYPIKEAAVIARDQFVDFTGKLKNVIMCLHSDEDYQVFQDVFIDNV